MKTASTLQHFVLKEEDGKLYLQSPDGLIEVSNQKVVHGELFDKYDANLEPGKVYTLECSVEKRVDCSGIVRINDNTSGMTIRTVALVTFPQPEAKEEPEDLLQWLKDERNILSNTASMMWTNPEGQEKAKKVADCLRVTIEYIELSFQNLKP